MVKVTVNGKKKEIKEPLDLAKFLQLLDINPRLIAVGYNGEVINRAQYSQVVLKDGDNIDIVHMVGGG